jgi:hypothetical protein
VQYFGLIFVLPVAALSIWVIATTFCRLKREHAEPECWSKALLMAAIGVGLGVWFSFFLQYQPIRICRFAGFPIPTHVEQFADETWKESAMPATIRIASHATDFLFGVALGIAPLGVGVWIRDLRESLKPDEP